MLLGGDGADQLRPGIGRDRVDAGPGPDTLTVRDGWRDVVRCGRGGDVVFADRRDRIAPDCERVFRV